MKHYRLLTICLLAGTLAVAGCTTYDVREGIRPAVEVVAPGTQARLDNVGFLTRDLERRVAVQKSGADRTLTNTLEVWCTLRNRTNFEQKLLMRTQYFTDDRVAIEDPDEWQPVYLAANAIETYRTYSIGKLADHYYIEVMEAP